MEWAIIGKFAKTYWSQIALGLVILGMSITLGVTRHTLSVRTQTLHNTEMAYQNLQNEVKNKTEAAKVADEKHANDIHQKDEAVRIDHEQTIQDQLDRAKSAAADYARELRRKATGDTRSVGSSGVGPVAPTPGTTADPGKGSVVDETEDDLQICAENTVKAQGWPDWWHSIQAVPDRQ